MGEIEYIRGDATVPSVKGVKVIAHVCRPCACRHTAGDAPRRGAGNCATSHVLPADAHGQDVLRRGACPTQRSATPRIGCGLARGKWSRVEPLIIERLTRQGITVTVYDHEGGGS